MKNLVSWVALSASLLVATAVSAADMSITGYWLKTATVEQVMTACGGTMLKIYAGIDDGGQVCYLMVGGDNSYRTVGSAAHMQNKKGVCPPLCDIASVDLGDENSATISKAQASQYINNYMSAHPGEKNCARFKLADLAGMMESAAYIKVDIGGKGATATGLQADGGETQGAAVAGSMATSGI